MKVKTNIMFFIDGGTNDGVKESFYVGFPPTIQFCVPLNNYTVLCTIYYNRVGDTNVYRFDKSAVKSYNENGLDITKDLM